MGDYLNGVYIPSVEDQLLHYGKKGMKWKKKGDEVGADIQDALDDVDERDAIAAQQGRIRDLRRDIDALKKNETKSFSKVKGDIKGEGSNRKPVNPKEQKYYDDFKRSVQERIKREKSIEGSKNIVRKINKARKDRKVTNSIRK